jgi:CRP/FNR family cyclic AMP-dependent transcriptional regulator
VDISMYLKGAQTERFRAGDVIFPIFRRGDPGDRMYLVKEGEVELTYGPGRSARVGLGASFGEMSLLERAERSADGVAVVDTELYPINRQLFLVLVGDTPYFALEIMKSLSNRLRTMTELAGRVD